MLVNNILWENLAAAGHEIALESASTLTISYCDVDGGEAETFTSGGSIFAWGDGNIDADPLFTLPAAGDYYLSEGSPCIDAGCDAGIYTDIEGNPRPFDFPNVDNNGELPEFDMGAYEAVPPGELAISIAPDDGIGTPIDPATTPLILDCAYILTVSCDPAVPAESSLTLTLEYDNAYMTIAEPAIINGGNASVDLALSADAATVILGVWDPPVTVNVSAPEGYAPASADYDIGYILGDVNDDNIINVSDLMVVRGQLGNSGSAINPLSADVNGDTAVNVSDLMVVRGQLGNSGCQW